MTSHDARYRSLIVELTHSVITKDGDLLLPGTRGVLLGWADREVEPKDMDRTDTVLVRFRSYMFADGGDAETDKGNGHTQVWSPRENEERAQGFLADVPVHALKVVNHGG